MNMARRRRKGEVEGKDGLRESKRIERTFKSIGLPSLECSKAAREKKDLSWVRKHGWGKRYVLMDLGETPKAVWTGYGIALGSFGTTKLRRGGEENDKM
jgi:hypothetical protein